MRVILAVSLVMSRHFFLSLLALSLATATASPEEKKLDPSPLHTHTFAFNQLLEAIRYFRDKVDGAIKVVIKPQEFRD